MGARPQWLVSYRVVFGARSSHTALKHEQVAKEEE